jgi:high-affinity iron transporter
MGVWFSIYPTVETIVAQVLAAFVVIGSYYAARRQAAPAR